MQNDPLNLHPSRDITRRQIEEGVRRIFVNDKKGQQEFLRRVDKGLGKKKKGDMVWIFAAVQHSGWRKETDCSRGLEQDLPAPQKIQLRPRG